jgi:hypothetical protein
VPHVLHALPPPLPKSSEVFFVPEPPKARSIFGTSSSRLISSKLLVEVSAAALSVCNDGKLCYR